MTPIASKRLLDAYDAAVEIEEMIEGFSFSQYLGDRKTQFSVLYLFVIIGEALAKISKSDPGIVASLSSFDDIIGMRNRIVHGYDQVDHVTVWTTATEDLLKFRVELQEIITVAGDWPY